MDIIQYTICSDQTLVPIKKCMKILVAENIHPNLEWENILWYTFLKDIYTLEKD